MSIIPDSVICLSLCLVCECVGIVLRENAHTCPSGGKVYLSYYRSSRADPPCVLRQSLLLEPTEQSAKLATAGPWCLSSPPQHWDYTTTQFFYTGAKTVIFISPQQGYVLRDIGTPEPFCPPSLCFFGSPLGEQFHLPWDAQRQHGQLVRQKLVKSWV